MSVYAFVFPGQGSQSPGMGQDLADAFPAAREVFQEVDDALEQKLSKIIFEGPAEELTSTENTQPALMAVSMAVVRVLEREGGVDFATKATLMAGHSLGEYSALAAARSFGIAETARLLRLRGRAMQRAVPAGEGGMAALIGVTPEQAQEVCEEAAVLKVEGLPDQREILEVANDNGGGQIVISGQMAAIDRAIVIAKEKGIKRAVKLPVSAPFHSSLMRPAADEMAEALDKAEVKAPIVPIVANVTAAKVTSPDMIRELLVKQVTGTVRWRESVDAMVGMGVDHFVELGAGKVLSGLIRRIAPDAKTESVGTLDTIDSFLRTL
ncbi:malonyl-CoA-[acyl-carrier-protein (ACP)] transacylase [Acetobacter aceti NRIC 0242]|uniref:Malonyl CoA-acyl carrier protein transacylase n=1 Tax=Acetobacter aceti NBRC 14818 TaxID=887700 RepID=A0AB33IB70_ACEAC|nr:ACP S-malonyltransferase [Acetobacter aceti]TCS34893.1 [acyl-carrier-protein] S-malonyltransferase [Acetobacter aceti NBRC 14818]BCK74529.1 malonyl CoA-acyl carrier protein transacylase [Acetobacter aceti NBRC 14818]GAN56038.1 malonyl-CoA-(acyl carrier protein) transacylase [Acetobacter aceti NBRC 14818]GBO80121.1 malonyl-CoA-[acyl-carrier-protein (ACP)] transacylase [Acetobacter aceti NRIC 0242]